MKNVFLIVIVLVIGFVSKAQTPFSTPNLLTGGATKITQNKGAGQFDSGLIVTPRFTDTASANLSVVKLYPGMLIRVLDTLWMRNVDATAWNKMGGSAGSAGSYVDGIYRTPGIDSIYFTISGTTYAIKDSTDEDACDVIVDVLADITEMEDYSGNALTVIVTDSLRGGIFNYYSSGLTTDDGIVFDATGKGSGYWKRSVTESDAANVSWFGAVGDGSTDNTTAFKNASRYRKVIVPKGTYKLDRTELNTTNFYLDSAVFVSTTYEPYITGNVSNTYRTNTYKYGVYNPTVTIDTVFAGVPSTYQYNHDATIAYFNSKFYVFWNGNPTGGTEGASNQLNYMSTSTDANHWTSPVAVFDDAAYSNNPMPYAESAMKQWQPNAIVLADRMIVFWTETQSSPNGWATYMSVLMEGATKFTTYRIDINSTTRIVDMNSDLSSSPASGYSTLYPSDNDSSYTLFSTQNPYLLNRGRLLAPFVAQNQTGLFYERDKFATVLYSDSPTDTASYKFSGLFQGGTTASAWEPYFTESKNGDVYMHLRNLGTASTVTTDANQELLISSDGINFGGAANDGIIAPSSRGYAQRMSSNRYGMSFNDADNNIRVNGSFLLSRFGEIDFAQGVSLQKNTSFPGDSYFNYPQSIVYRDSVYVIYTNYYEPRSVVLAKFPMPGSDDRLQIIPRNRPKKYLSSYADVGNTRLNMTGSRSLLMNVPMIVGDADSINSHQSVSFSFWAQKQSDYSTATLFDSRGSTLSDADFKQKGGGIASSFVTMGNSNSNVNLVDNLNYSLTNYTGLTTRLMAFPSYLGLTFDTPNRTLSVYYDDGTCSGCNASQFYDKYYYWNAIEITQNFANNETITIDGTVYTAKTSPSLSTEFQIDDSLVVTCSNLKSVVTGFDIVGFGDTTNLLASDTIMMAFFKTASFATITSTNAGVSAYTKNLFDSPAGQYGAALSTTSTLTGIGGWIYNLRIYRGATDGVLSANNHRYLFNRLASTFGYTNKTSTTAATNFYVNLQYDSLNDVTYQFTNLSRTEYEYSSDTLTLYSNSSAGIETDGENFTLSVQYKATIPTDDDVVIMSFQDRDNSNQITIDSSGNIRLNGIPVLTVNPDIKNNLTITYKDKLLLINGTFKYEVNNRPRFYLGNYSVFNNMGDEYYVTYYLNKSSCTVLK